jgi:hypothetical protein
MRDASELGEAKFSSGSLNRTGDPRRVQAIVTAIRKLLARNKNLMISEVQKSRQSEATYMYVDYYSNSTISRAGVRSAKDVDEIPDAQVSIRIAAHDVNNWRSASHDIFVSSGFSGKDESPTDIARMAVSQIPDVVLKRRLDVHRSRLKYKGRIREWNKVRRSEMIAAQELYESLDVHD